MNKITGAMYIIKFLHYKKIDHIFGYPGGAVLPIYDALVQQDDVQHILVRTEQSGVHAAAAYGKANGRVGAALGTSGPGATNLVTGIATAYMDSIPLLVFTGQVVRSQIGSDAFQEADITGITHPCVKHSYLIKDIKNLKENLEEAYEIATTGRKGPVLIDIPKDVLNAMVTDEIFTEKVKIRGYKPTITGNCVQIKRAAKLINESSKPLIWAGGGAVSGKCEGGIKSLVEDFKIPIVNTLMGTSVYDQTKELALGLIGMHGTAYGNFSVKNCDLLINIGSRFSDRSTGDLNKFLQGVKVIHIDIDPAEISKIVPADVPIVGDCKSIVKELLTHLEKKDRLNWLKEIKDLKEEFDMTPEKSGLTPQKIVSHLGNLYRDDCLLTTDVGQHQMFSAQHFLCSKFNSFFTSGGLGTMGYGVPAALGAALGQEKNKKVVCITGDGSFQMNMNEMATICEADANVAIILFNNNSLNMVRQLQHFQCNKRYSGVDFTCNPDFSQIAGAYDKFAVFKLAKEEDIDSILTQAMEHVGPSFIECIIENDDIVYPIVFGTGIHEMIGANIKKERE